MATTTNRSSAPQLEDKRGGLYTQAWHELRRNRAAVAGGIVLILFILAAVFAPYLTPYDPIGRSARERLLGPSLAHPMGTDSLGRDILGRILYGGRISLQVGFLAILTSAAAGVPLGLIAGYFGGKVDNIVMRIMDIIMSFPGLVLAIWLVSVLGSSLINVILAIAFFSLPTFARLTRGTTLSVREMEYVLAAHSMGAGSLRILVWHILPAILGPLIVLSTLSISGAIVTGASLSFLGLGVAPPTPEWGSMLSDGRGFLRNAWWIAFFPGMIITIVVMAANILGDGLRDALDPYAKKH